jgi:hypothetical protein
MLVPYFGILTVGVVAQRLPANLDRAAKLFIQNAPGNTGNIKIGTDLAMTSDATTPGTFLAPGDDATSPGGSWSLETQTERNTIDVQKYAFHGSNAGDSILYEVQVHV